MRTMQQDSSTLAVIAGMKTHTKYTPVNPQPGDMPHAQIAERLGLDPYSVESIGEQVEDGEHG